MVSGEAFLEFLAGHPETSRALLAALARQIQAHEAFTEDLLFLDLKGRVAKRLLQLTSPGLDELPPDGSVSDRTRSPLPPGNRRASLPS